MDKHMSGWTTILALMLSAVQVSCGPAEVRWSLDYNQVMKQIAAEHGMALLLIDGPDWNKPSKELRQNLLQTKEFAQFVQDNNIYTVEAVISDPTKRGVTPAVAEILQGIFMRYGVQSIPALVLIDETGLPFCKIEGGDADKAVQTLRKTVNLRYTFINKLREARSSQGEQRAILLMQARNLLPQNLRDVYPKLNEEILANDPRDATGLKRIIARRDLLRSQFTSVNSKAKEYIGDPAKLQPKDAASRLRDAINKLLADEQWLPEVRQYMYEVLMTSYLAEGNVSEAINYLKEAIDAAPDTDQANALRKRLEAMQTPKDTQAQPDAPQQSP